MIPFIQDAIITLFMYDADVLYVINEHKAALGDFVRKDSAAGFAQY